MQGRRGAGRKLRDLSAEKLGRRIQRSGQRHSPMCAGWHAGWQGGAAGGAGSAWLEFGLGSGALDARLPAALLPSPACTAAAAATCREDAQAALDLYVQHVMLDTRNWTYEDLVELELAAILASASGSVDEGTAGGSMGG